jgi:hypothetical protein
MSDTGKSSSAHVFSFINATNHFLNIKYDRVLKLKRIESYRAWRDTAELLLDALDLWDLLIEKKQPSTSDDDDKKQNYIDRKRNYILFLFQTTDTVILLILTTNKKLNKIWVALKKKFDMKTIETFLV